MGISIAALVGLFHLTTRHGGEADPILPLLPVGVWNPAS